MDTNRENAPAEHAARTAEGAVSRRRLLRGGAAATPVVLSLASKPVMAGVCTSASAFASINASRPNATATCTGQTPGTWKTCDSKLWPQTGNYTRTGTWGNCGMAGHSQVPTTATLLQVVSYTETSGPRCVAAHIAATLLNIQTLRVPATIINIDQARRMWNDFVSRNGLYSPSAGTNWDHLAIVNYLKTTM